MKTTRIANALRGLMQAKASGKLNIILNVTPQVLNLPHDRSIDAKIMRVSPTGEATLHTEEGEIRIFTNRKLMEGQDFKLSTKKDNGTTELILKSPATDEEIHLKMPADFKKMLTEKPAGQTAPAAQSAYTKPSSTANYQTPNSALPNTSLFSFLSILDRKGLGAKLEAAGAMDHIPQLGANDFVEKLLKTLNFESEFHSKFGGLEYMQNARAASNSLSTDAWSFFCIPMKFAGEVQQMKLIIEDQDPENSVDFTGARKFWIEINPEKLGRIQIDGMYTIADRDSETFLKISAEKPLSEDIQMELSLSARAMHADLGLMVVLQFVDYNKRRDDAFQVLLENYCRSRANVSVYA